MAKQKIVVTKQDGTKATFLADDRRNAERDAAAMRKNFADKIHDIEIKNK